MANLTAELMNKYCDVDFISDEVACNVGDDDDNFVAKILEKNYDAAVSFYDVFEGLIDEIEGSCGYRNFDSRLYAMINSEKHFDNALASQYIELLNSDSYINDENESDVLEMREYINDLITLVGVKNALEIASNFNPDNL